MSGDTRLSYLERLMLRLIVGASSFPDEVRNRHGEYVLAAQQPDGGWRGREGASDPYYTSFALRSLTMLGLLEGPVAERAADFLRSRTQGNETIVDLLSLIYSVKLIEAACGIDAFADLPTGWQARVPDLLERLRCADGGYGKTFESRAGSTYQTFLTLLCYQLLDYPVPSPEQVVEFLEGQRRPDGGFVEVRVGKRSGANPTAAGVGALVVLDRLTPEIGRAAAVFLSELQTAEGGFQANSRIPVADVLSTFTALVTLADAHAMDLIYRDAVEKYILSMERLGGGFAGFEFDVSEDVEYTFYGLGSLAMLNAASAR
ncbi:MAG: beta-hydroxylase [Planctomycetota bacterium]|nr:MAG: beta-hydroxylase [Planctomycetota bacterium]